VHTCISHPACLHTCSTSTCCTSTYGRCEICDIYMYMSHMLLTPCIPSRTSNTPYICPDTLLFLKAPSHPHLLHLSIYNTRLSNAPVCYITCLFTTPLSTPPVCYSTCLFTSPVYLLHQSATTPVYLMHLSATSPVYLLHQSCNVHTFSHPTYHHDHKYTF